MFKEQQARQWVNMRWKNIFFLSLAICFSFILTLSTWSNALNMFTHMLLKHTYWTEACYTMSFCFLYNFLLFVMFWMRCGGDVAWVSTKKRKGKKKETPCDSRRICLNYRDNCCHYTVAGVIAHCRSTFPCTCPQAYICCSSNSD